MLEGLLTAMAAAIEALEAWPGDEVLVTHHNDADGLSSGAILSRALSRHGRQVRRCCLEKPYPAVLERLLGDGPRALVLADFGGRIAPLVSDLNRNRNLVLILDHHKASPATSQRVHNLDPELYGLQGDRDISASTTCFLFARLLDPGNADLAPLAVIGAVGDGFLVDGRLAGANREVCLEARAQGRVVIDDEGAGERYTLLTRGGPLPFLELTTYLDTLGAVGYSQGGPELGVAVCLEGRSAASDEMVARLAGVRQRAFASELERIRAGGLVGSRHIQWLHVGDRFRPMGVKMIGVFLESLRDGPEVDRERYLAGFQRIPDEIPGVGCVPQDQVKISMRVSTPLAARIRAGEAPGLDTFLPAATARLDGFADACHSLSAATTVAVGLEARLIEEMESELARMGVEA
jgi:hypothetical protein